MSNSNDLIILNQVLEQKRQAIAPNESATDYFEIFSAEQVLKDFDLGFDLLKEGIVDGGGDGGIDGIFLFINGEPLQEDSDLSVYKKEIILEVVVLQSKTSESFTEGALDKLNASSRDLFSLSVNLATLKSVYNSKLIEQIGLFRKSYTSLASRFPKLKFRFFYVSKGEAPHQNVERKVGTLRESVKGLFSQADFEFTFIGARKLLEIARQTVKTSFSLPLAENPISSGDAVAFVCMVKLIDFYQFVTDGKGKLQRHIFEANVRDYQGQTSVNQQIQETLSSQGQEDFWWLNNGVTIIATRANSTGKALQIENPEIVNGLQTSNELFNRFKAGVPSNEKRTLLVRVIVPTDTSSRDKIIRATNSQTAIQPASLRATDKIHRDIEDLLLPYGFFYDRRKNFYKNEGKSVDKIIGISVLAQALMSLILRRPESARGKPSSLLKDDAAYNRLYASNLPVDLYLRAVQLLSAIDNGLRNFSPPLNTGMRGELRFHSLMTLASLVSKKASPTAADLVAVEISKVTPELVSKCIQMVKTLFDTMGGGATLMKGPDLLKALEIEVSKVTALEAAVPQVEVSAQNID
jgi:hypothetical protein